MTISVPIPGLDTYVPSIEAGWFLLVEGGPEPDKDFFVDLLARTFEGAEASPAFVTSRDAAAARIRMPGAHVVEAHHWTAFQQGIVPSGLAFVDSLSAIAADAPTDELAATVREWRKAAQEDEGLFVATAEEGMLPMQQTQLLRHLADAIVQFRVREDADSVQTSLRIPRWGARHSVRQPIHYQFTGDRLALDTRRRHV